MARRIAIGRTDFRSKEPENINGLALFRNAPMLAAQLRYPNLGLCSRRADRSDAQWRRFELGRPFGNCTIVPVCEADEGSTRKKLSSLHKVSSQFITRWIEK
jgi:hypothetical protein